VHLLARVVRRDEVLVAVLDPFHRPARSHRRDRDEHVLGVQLATRSEAAAHAQLDEPDPFGRQVEDLRQRVPVEVLHLRGAPHGEPGVRVLGDEPARFQRRGRLPVDDEPLAYDDVRAREETVDVAVPHRHPVDDLSGLELDHGAEVVELQDDLLGGVLRDVGVLREQERDRLADVAHDVPGDRRLERLP